MTNIFTAQAREIISRIPAGKVTTYGIIALYAGNRNGARQVARILYSSSDKYNLPWHRVVNRNGRISPRSSMGHLFQKQLLEDEGVILGEDEKIDFSLYLWRPQPSEEKSD